MATNILWTTETWNIVVGCSRISEGCKNCYAADAAKSARLQQFPQYKSVKNWDGTTEFVEAQLLKPLGWKKPKKIFVCSMADLFHESVPFKWVDKVLAMTAIAHQHTYQILTKRMDRMVEYFSDPNRARWIMHEVMDILRNEEDPMTWRYKVKDNQVNVRLPLPNVWLGSSVENQKVADTRIPLLLKVPAAVRFLSCEPLLEQVDLSEWLPKKVDAPNINWVIVGGESGSKARVCNVNWLRSLVYQCKETDTKVFVKQLGSYVTESLPYLLGIGSCNYRLELRDRKGGDIDEFPEDLKIREFPVLPVEAQ